MYQTKPDERFWSKVKKTDTCWIWIGSRHPKGHGMFWDGHRRVYAHRWVYESVHGKIPERMQIDHRCHNRSCVRIDHLRLATPKQNEENRSGATRVSKTGIRGVSLHRASGLWRGTVRHGGQQISAGYFHDIAAAEAAVIAKRNELFTHNDLDRTA